MLGEPDRCSHSARRTPERPGRVAPGLDVRINQVSESEPYFPPPAKPARRQRAGVREQSSATKRAVLEASTRLFVEQGYGATTIDDIVKTSRVSVGSLYHQFGGKNEVFIALAQEEMRTRIAARDRAVRLAAEAGETRPDELFCTGARAHLLEMWRSRDISRVLWGDDVPTGFADYRRRTEAKFIIGATGVELGLPQRPELGAYAVIALMHAAALQLLDAPDIGAVTQIIDYFTDLIRQLTNDASGPVFTADIS